MLQRLAAVYCSLIRHSPFNEDGDRSPELDVGVGAVEVFPKVQEEGFVAGLNLG